VCAYSLVSDSDEGASQSMKVALARPTTTTGGDGRSAQPGAIAEIAATVSCQYVGRARPGTVVSSTPKVVLLCGCVCATLLLATHGFGG
jgi:hypothetical protein